jgi:uncharacterized protein (DUF302 family)
MTPEAGDGVVSRRSSYSVDETVERLKKLLETKGVKLFALIDHSGEAEKAGIHIMPPTRLLIFGNPAAGTPLMLAAPGLAIDLPLKILVWEDREGATWLSWNSPEYLMKRYGIPEEMQAVLGAAEKLAAQAGS